MTDVAKFSKGDSWMKRIDWIRGFCVTGVVLGLVGAHGQEISASAATPATSKTAQSIHLARAADRQLEKSVRKTLSRVKGLVVTNIVVVAKSGVVILTGTVPETNQIDLAVSAAQTVGGVSTVKNELGLKAVGQ
jgi:osmotically-inducible protein OsmY